MTDRTSVHGPTPEPDQSLAKGLRRPEEDYVIVEIPPDLAGLYNGQVFDSSPADLPSHPLPPSTEFLQGR